MADEIAQGGPDTQAAPPETPPAAASSTSAAAPATPPPAPLTQRVNIGGRVFDVPAELAAALTASIPPANPSSVFSPASTPSAPPLNAEPAADWWTDPEAAAKRLQENIVQSVVQMYQQERAREQARATVEKFWQDFKNENSDLRDAVSLAKAVLNDHPELLDMRINDARVKLAELTRLERNRIIQSAGGSAPPTETLRGQVEGSGLPSSPGASRGAQFAGTSEVQSLSDALRLRRARLRGGK